MKASRLAALVAAIALIMAAVPAAASGPLDEQDTGTFTGTANVGAGFEDEYFIDNEWVTVDECQPDGKTAISGPPGLHLPDPLGEQGIRAAFQISTDLTGLLHGPGEFHVCGWVKELAGIGAACLWSESDFAMGSGHLGDHEFTFDEISFVAPGGTIPVTGRYTLTNGPDEGQQGQIVATVQAQEAEPDACLSEEGADGFVAIGTFTFTRPYLGL